MARQRTLKPGFFTNEDLAACAPLTRLFFEGLWCWADREGRLEDRPRRLKAEILPYDNADGETMVAELIDRSFLERYEVDGVKVLQVLNFERHQNPHPKEVASVLPPKPGSAQSADASGEPRESNGTSAARSDPATEEPRQGPTQQRTCRAGISGVSGISSPSRSLAPLARAGGRAKPKLGELGVAAVAQVATGLGHGIRPASTQADADEFEERIRAVGGVAAAVEYFAATCRQRDSEPEGVGLLLAWLRDLGPPEGVAAQVIPSAARRVR